MMDDGERALFAQSLRGALECPTPAAVDEALAASGWHDALDHDTRTAVSLLFELQGTGPATSSALADLLVRAIEPRASRPTGLVLPVLGAWDPPARLDGDTVDVRGLGLAALAARDRVLVPSGAGELAVAVTTTDLDLRPVHGIDAALGLVEVRGDAVAIDESIDAATPWPATVALGRLAVAHELVGAARTMLDHARDHALGRVQFGRPIAGFQAVRHRLADTLVAIETAEAVLAAAWEDESTATAAMAKALAGRAARTAARHGQQVLAGIGFTTEHPFHRSVRRTLVLDELLGADRTLTHGLGDDLSRTRRLPALLPL
jgi:hypothetical protein